CLSLSLALALDLSTLTLAPRSLPPVRPAPPVRSPLPHTTLFRSPRAAPRDHPDPRADGGTGAGARPGLPSGRRVPRQPAGRTGPDRKITRLNSSHVKISYAVFCLKKKKKTPQAPDWGGVWGARLG